VTQTQGEAESRPDRERKRANPVVFTKQIVAELRKVRWPTRRELITYTIVVMVFVLVMIGFIMGLDYIFGEAVLWVYGDGSPG
jgi:preprotein translocase subunit SecE